MSLKPPSGSSSPFVEDETVLVTGLRGDGSDDSAIIQAGLAASRSVVQLPEGTFDVSSILTLGSGPTTIRGRGKDKTIIRVRSGASLAGGLFQGTNVQVAFEDLTLDGNKANTTALSDDTKQQLVYVVTTSSSKVAFRRVRVKNGERVGVYLTNNSTANTHEAEFEDFDVEDCTRQGVLIARPSKVTGSIRAQRCGDSNSDQVQIGINATDGGSNINVDVEAHDGGRNGLTFLGVTDFRFRSYTTGNGVDLAVAAQGHGTVISEGCRDFIGDVRSKDNYALNFTCDPRTAASATLKDVEGIVSAEVSGSVTSHGFYAQYSKGLRATVVSRGNADDGVKLVSCQNVHVDATALNNTGHGVSIVDGSGTGSGPGGKNYVRVLCAGNGTDTVEDTAASKSEVLISGRRGWEMLAQSAVAATVNTGTAEVALATVTVPANTLGPNGRVRVTTLWTVTSSANNKTMRVRFGGTGGDVYQAVIATTSATVRLQTEWANRNSTSSQVGSATALTGGWGVGTGAVVTGAKATSSAQDIVISGQPASAGETITLESYSVEVLPL